MNKLGRVGVWTLAASLAALAGCETDDPRPGPPPVDLSDRQFGEQCGGMGDPACASGLTCFNGTCTQDRFATACTPNPCGTGVCNARGEAGMDILAFCRCGSGEEWDGFTCVAGGPGFAGDVTADTTCPAEEIAPMIPDETTADCPMGSFCTEPADGSGGDCLEFNLSVSGTLNGKMLDITATSTAIEAGLQCVREYITDGEGDSAGLKLVMTGDLATALVDGATSVTIDLSEFDAIGGGSAIVWPQAMAPAPGGDAGFVDIVVEGGASAGTLAAVGGDFTISSVSGPDADEDGLIDDSMGAVGGTFYIGLPGTEFVAGAFVAPCGMNELVAGSGM